MPKCDKCHNGNDYDGKEVNCSQLGRHLTSDWLPCDLFKEKGKRMEKNENGKTK